MSRFTTEHLERIEAFHQQVDGLSALVEDKLGDRLVCRQGCHDCCADDLTVLEIEAELIKHHHGELLQDGSAGPLGGCAFLDGQGSCRIYAHRPYICRTQGLPLRWFDGPKGENENRDICPLNLDVIQEKGETLAQFPGDYCWTIGTWEGKLASLQAEASGRFELVRVDLRSLFQP